MTKAQEKKILSALLSHLRLHAEEVLSDPEEWFLEDRIPTDLTDKEIGDLIKKVLT